MAGMWRQLKGVVGGRRLSFGRVPAGSRFLICFFLGLVAGAVAANLLYPSLKQEAGYYISLLSSSVNLSGQELRRLFSSVCRQRMIEVILAWMVGLTVYAVPFFCILTAGFGFSVAVTVTIMTGRMGLMGLPFFFASVMPQALFYVPVWCLLLLGGVRNRRGAGILNGLLILGLTFLGSAGETWLNPVLLKLFL